MAWDPQLRELVNPELLVPPRNVEFQDQGSFSAEVFNLVTFNTIQSKTTTPSPAKDILDVLDLTKSIIEDYESRLGTTQDGKVEVFYENPDREIVTEAISLSIVSREPGAYAKGAPGKGKVKNRKPILREKFDDPDHPGYKRAVLGYFYDNIVRMTAWAKTNKAANERALWLEGLIEEYDWLYVFNGINRIIYEGWKKNETLDINGQRYYGRPIDYFVRTERLTNVSQKTLEQVSIKFSIGTE